jgi:hypothetical protein
MVGYRPNHLVRIGFAVAALGLLSAFTYPLVQEGYEMVGASVYRDAQSQLIEQLMSEYITASGDPSWTSATSTQEILGDMSKGVEVFGGRRTFLPPSENVESLSSRYRIIYKGPHSFKIIAR